MVCCYGVADVVVASVGVDIVGVDYGDVGVVVVHFCYVAVMRCICVDVVVRCDVGDGAFM